MLLIVNYSVNFIFFNSICKSGLIRRLKMGGGDKTAEKDAKGCFENC